MRRVLGFLWFYLLAFTTAIVVISTDADMGSLASTLSLPNLPAIILLSLLIALAAVPSLIWFYQRKWSLGILVALIAGVVVWGAILTVQTTTSPLTIREGINLLPTVILICGGWMVLVSLPAALLLSREQGVS